MELGLELNLEYNQDFVKQKIGTLCRSTLEQALIGDATLDILYSYYYRSSIMFPRLCVDTRLFTIFLTASATSRILVERPFS
jgi:hypothetical protein